MLKYSRRTAQTRQRTFVPPKNRNEHGHLALVSSGVEEQSSIMSSWHHFRKGSKAGRISTLQPLHYSEGHYSLTMGLPIPGGHIFFLYHTTMQYLNGPSREWRLEQMSSVPNEWMRLKIVRRWEISQTLPLLSVHWSGAVEPSPALVVYCLELATNLREV